jgi:hypothetical protein
MTIRHLYPPGLLIVVVVALLLERTDVPAPVAARPGPRTMEEVIGLVQKLGLHYRSDHKDGRVGSRLVVSDSPLTWQRANALRMGPNKDSDRNGTVAVLQSNSGMAIAPDERMEAWGDFFVYGDPSLIKRLTDTATAEDGRP